MKISNIKCLAFALVAGLGMTSCNDFLDRPTEDSYTTDGYYGSDEECIAGVNYLYNSPWYDFQRGFIWVGEVMSGNLYSQTYVGYYNFTLNGSDATLVSMSESLWAVVGHSNIVYNNIKRASGPSESVKNQCMGECLTWKAFAYFYLVRTFGEVPIIHDTEAELASGTYNNVKKVKRADVYEYIIMTLEKAMELLPESSSAGRIDKYCAEGLLAKVYLAKAGVSGSLDADDLSKAAQYAKDVIDNSGRELLSNYSDVFRLANNTSDESLIAWRWTVGTQWTCQNTLQSDLGMTGFDEFGDTWGDWNAPSVDLQEAFGVKLLEQTPDSWINNIDTRCKATMMLPGYTYSYFWKDQGGFSYLDFIYNTDYNSSAPGQLNSGTGANVVKHLYGNNNDHVDGTGVSAKYMQSSLATHILRLSDIYLIYAEAKLGTNRATSSDADVIDAFYAVHHRAVPTATRPSSVSWDDIWKERRLEFALEGDRWYDFVRVSYYDPDFCVNELMNQKRNVFYGLDEVYKDYYNNGTWTITSSQSYDTSTSAPSVTNLMKTDPDSGKRYFYIPMSAEDVLYNPNLGSSVNGEHVDVRATYSYD